MPGGGRVRAVATVTGAGAVPERLRHALDGVAEGLAPCAVPDVAAGFDRCPCGYGGTWPCPTTEAAWLARGVDPASEARRILARTGGEEPLPDGCRWVTRNSGDVPEAWCEAHGSDHGPLTTVQPDLAGDTARGRRRR